ncbi:tetratricopeptide repeat protein [Salinibacter altiplanensis]|uniref:tetratricopeptide repeat protein n=1 Tax=Salinibacter altiplanensis TaxID=1803181 RepID=UPI001F2E4E76|nr:hypothetical protein [Salinibacter altiplanensis]
MRPRAVRLIVLSLLVCGGVLPALASAQSSSGATTVDATGVALQETLTTVDSLRQAGAFRRIEDRLLTLRNRHPGRAGVLWRLSYTWSDLGMIADDGGQRRAYYKKALDAARSAVASDSSSAWAHFAMAVAQGRLASGGETRERVRRSRAVKHHADRAIALDSTLSGAYHVRGRWHREVTSLGFFQTAIVRTFYGGLPEASLQQAVLGFQQAIKFRDKAFHHLELGKTYRRMDRLDDARRQFETVLEMPPSGPFASSYRREARRRLEKLE